MRSNDLILDDEHHLWHWPFFSLAESLRSVQAGEKLARYAVVNLGFVHFQFRPSGLIINLRPELVLARTITNAIYFLSDLPSQRTVLTCLETSWEHRVCRGRAEAVKRLNGILQRREAKTRTPNFLSRAIDTERMSARNPFAQLVRFWSNHQTSFDQERIDKILRGPLQGRYLVVAPAPERGALIMQHWGDRLGSYDPTWARRARGVPLHEQPDYRYGSAAATAYKAALHSRHPVCEQVDAVVSKTRGANLRLRYMRLILPFEESDGRMRLLSTSLLDPTIDLRSALQVG
jgi:hypothetical protein